MLLDVWLSTFVCMDGSLQFRDSCLRKRILFREDKEPVEGDNAW